MAGNSPTPAPTASASAMNVIAALLEQRTGQQIAANRAWRIETALKPLLREKQLASLDALVAQLVLSRSPELGEAVVDALLNQETSFFRDAAVIEMVAAAAIAMQAEAGGRRLRIWSAGCSNGQEPLSLAMLLHENGLFDGPTAPEIIGTDISPAALARARAARYSQFEIQRGLPVRRMVEWFEPAGNDWAARPELVRRIQFRPHNLVVDPAPSGRFDIVLCRNVLLYFSLPLRQRVFDMMAQAIRPGGLLVLGAGETVIGQTSHFKPSEQYRGLYVAGNAAERSAAAGLPA